MTRAEIDNLPAGAEADVMCARAMGAGACGDTGPIWIEGSALIAGLHGTRIFRPSTDIADAMVLAEIMRKDQWVRFDLMAGPVNLVLWGVPKDAPTMQRRGRRRERRTKWEGAHAPTLPLAIVRAFLTTKLEAAE